MTAIRVSDLDASLAFYVERLGFRLTWHDPEAGVAQVDAAGYPVLLAGPDAPDLRSYLDETHEVVQPGGTLFVHSGDLDALAAMLAARGVDFSAVEQWWGDRSLLATDPDGYTVAFFTLTERTQDETLALYAQGPERLEEALAGLSEADLDLALRPGAWTIRQIVHHIADSEATALAGPKFAIAEPGRLYLRNPYSQSVWAESLNYAGRPVGPSVALFRAIREHMLDVITHVPGAWDSATRDARGHAGTPVGVFMGMLVSHAFEHIEDILEIRRAHGR